VDKKCSHTNCVQFDRKKLEPHLDQFKLNDSQLDAVISCVEASFCTNIPSVRLIWGPPGTGKTKTVAVMLHCFLRRKMQTLVCAPTNVAVMQVASQLVELIEKDLIEKGPQEMHFSFGDIVLFGSEDRMKVDKKLSKIYQHQRAKELSPCYDKKDGFKQHLHVVLQYLDHHQKNVPPKHQKDIYINILASLDKLASYTSTLLVHLPMWLLNDIDIFEVIASVEKLKKLLRPDGLCFDESLTGITEGYRNLVQNKFPDTNDCLDNATVILCTAAMSSQLRSRTKDFEILVIDEAANLKECDSMIPLKLPEFNNLFLVGDDKQLESMVKSKVCLRYKITHSCSYFTYLLILYPFCYLLDCKRP
jgi:senataxin